MGHLQAVDHTLKGSRPVASGSEALLYMFIHAHVIVAYHSKP